MTILPKVDSSAKILLYRTTAFSQEVAWIDRVNPTVPLKKVDNIGYIFFQGLPFFSQEAAWIDRDNNTGIQRTHDDKPSSRLLILRVVNSHNQAQSLKAKYFYS